LPGILRDRDACAVVDGLVSHREQASLSQTGYSDTELSQFSLCAADAAWPGPISTCTG